MIDREGKTTQTLFAVALLAKDRVLMVDKHIRRGRGQHRPGKRYTHRVEQSEDGSVFAREQTLTADRVKINGFAVKT